MLDRRNFLKRSSLVALAPTVPTFLARTARAVEPHRDDRVLVVVQLSGGNDGINTIVPYTDDGYEQNRKELRLPNDRLIKLNDEFALHPSMKDAHKLWESNRLAIVQGVGYPNPNRSHDVSMAIWQTGRFDRTEHTGYGWLGRMFDITPLSPTASSSAIFVGDEKTPIALRGRRSVTANIDRLEELLLPDGTRREKVAVATENSEGLTGFLRRSTLDAYATADQLSKLGVEDKSSTSRPDSELARRLQVIARLIKTDFKTRIYYTTQSGYDTHIEQLPTHARLMRELSGALHSFFEDLRAAKLDERVVVLCFSEFGRRVKENASKGTDHGTAGPVLLVGPSVEPGLHGTMPSMLDLEEGDLKYTVDFRRVYATILKSWMGVEGGLTIFGDFETLSLFRS